MLGNLLAVSFDNYGFSRTSHTSFQFFTTKNLRSEVKNSFEELLNKTLDKYIDLNYLFICNFFTLLDKKNCL